jgi:uncharacterized membrane protein YedE/YeeE
MKYSFLLFGAVFGFLLSRAGATTFDFYAKLFLLQDFQLLWVIVTAAAVGATGVLLLKRLRVRALDGRPLSYEGKPMRRGLVPGALLFGVGWGLSGSCPGTAPAMLGEGKLLAGFTILGILAGTYLYGRLHGSEKAGD